MGRRLFANSSNLSILVGARTGLSDEDARILRGLRAGIEEAYEELIAQYQQPVYSVAYRLLGNAADASDVVQEVFLKVFRGMGSFREHSSLRTWIYRITVNEARNHHRWFSRHCRGEVTLEEAADRSNPLDGAADPGWSPYDRAVQSENRTLIEQALEHINPVFRTAVVLRDIENLSYEEIAEILQVSLGTVKSRILRGREALRHELTERLDSGLAAAFV